MGVGFSYASNHKTVGTTEKGAKDIRRFMQLFMVAFPQFRDRAFHMAGESYAGRYLPLYAAAIADYAAHNKSSGLNLRSVMIGNGAVDRIAAVKTFYYQACTNKRRAT